MRKTKIIATIGPSVRSPEQLEALFEAGCNVVRINMSHSSQAEAAGIIADVRTISDRVGILLDTRGPEVRTTEVAGGVPVQLVVGQPVRLTGLPGETTVDCVHVNFSGLHRMLDEGAAVLLADGRILLEVRAVEPDGLRCRVVKGGELGSKKGVNVPGVKLPIPFLSAQDESDIRFAVRQQMDFIAISFVSDAEDVVRVREVVQDEGGDLGLIAKVEARFAVKNLGEIIAASDGVMVARGDLGVEIRAEEVPVVQRRIIEACRNAGKVVIVATEMLESMISSPRPTRAETSDVANAIFEGTDAVMLSGETSVGAFPIDAVRIMSRTAIIAEAEFARSNTRLQGGTRAADVTELICKGAWLAAQELRVRAILVLTASGRTALRISRYRPRVPILAHTGDTRVARRMSLSYGVAAEPGRHYGRMESMVRRSCQAMVDAGYLEEDDLVAVICGVPVGRSGSTNLLTLQPVSALIGSAPRDARA